MSSRRSSTLRIDVLGPLRLAVDGSPVPISREQVRCLATALGAHAGSFVPTDALIDLLWHDRLPAQPKAALLVATSRLRSALGPASSAIESGADGIRAVAESDLIDFQRMNVPSNMDPTAALTTIGAKLELWRGSPFGDFAQSELLRPLSMQLAEAWWESSVRSCELLAEVGQHGRCTELASPLHAREPHRERLTLVLARSLAQLGRRSEALAVLGSTRRHLRTEFGLDIGGSLGALEQEILSNAVDLSPIEQVAQPSAPGNFVGRRCELDWLSTHSPGLRVVRAEPGAGKSALLNQFEQRCVGEGRTVWSVRTPPRPDRPMAVAADLVARVVDSSAPPDHDELVHDAITRLTGRTLPSAPRLQAVTRDGLIQAAARYLALAVRRCDAVVVVDDAHWLDAGSAEVLERLAVECDVVLAGRLDPGSVLSRVVERVAAGNARVLPPLQRDEIAELAATRFRQADVSPTADVVWKQSAGNALFAKLLLEHLAEGGTVRRTDLPVSVLIAVQQRLDTLSASARDSLTCLSVFGDSAPTWAIADLRPSYERDLDEAVAAHLVGVEDEDNIAFVHGLVADAVYDGAGDGRRIELHDAIGRVLEAGGRPAGEVARHYHEAASLDPERAANAHLAAAIEAEQAFAWELAAEHAESGLTQTEDAVTSAKLAIHLARVHGMLHTTGSATALISAADAALAVGDNLLFVEAVSVLASQNWNLSEQDPVAIRALYDVALELDVPVAMRGRLCAAVASFVVKGGHPRARALYHEAVEIALELENPTDQADILRYARWGLGHPDDFALFYEVATLIADLAGDSPDLRWAKVSNRFTAGAIAGDRSLIDRAIDEFRAASMAGPSIEVAWETAHVEAGYSLLDGDHDGAESWLGRILELVAHEETDRDASVPIDSASSFRPIYGVLLLGVRRAQGRIAEMLPFVDAAILGDPSGVSWRCVAAGVAAAAGDLDRVRHELGQIETLQVSSLPHDFMWTATMKMYAEGIVASGDVQLAARARTSLDPYTQRLSWAGFCGAGPIDAVLADLAEVCGDRDAARTHRARAQSLEWQLGRTAGSPPLLRPDS